MSEELKELLERIERIESKVDRLIERNSSDSDQDDDWFDIETFKPGGTD